MERIKRKFVESNVSHSRSKSKRQKSSQKEIIVIKIDPLKIEMEDNFPEFETIEDPASTGNPVIPSKCPKCSISYKSQASMKNHVQVCKVDEHGQEAGSTERSEDVSVLFSLQNGIRKMEAYERHTIKILEQSCFGNVPSYDVIAMDDVTAQLETDFTCLECDQSFSGPQKYGKHLYAHTFIRRLEEELPCMCAGCGREFSSKQHLDMHVLTSSGGCCGDFKLVYTCKICCVMFTRKDNLRSHLRADHIYQQQSGKSYREVSNRKKNKKMYNCHYCLKSFGGSCLLTIHLKSHIGSKPFECPDCIQNFSDQTCFQLHLKQHKQAPSANQTDAKRGAKKTSACKPASISVETHNQGMCVKSLQQNNNLKITSMNLSENLDLSFDFEPIVKTESLVNRHESLKEEPTRPNPILPPGFKPVCLNKNGLVSKFGFAQSDKMDAIQTFKEEFVLDSIFIKEEPLN